MGDHTTYAATASKKLPIPGKRNILITSALPYVNNVPHLGNIIGCVLSADVFARYCRNRGYNAIYICGTDEYGTATETKALEEKCSPKEICDNCPTPGCNYDSARGDQCEKCGKLLNPTELLEPRCKVCGNIPNIQETNHLFLELPLLKDKLEEYINKMSVAGGWSQNAIQATHAWLREGLKQRCITRDLKWGVPVPHEKFKDKVFYVWFDAPIGYVSITSCYTPEWEKWWKNPEDVELYQFMGKDNVPFHTVMFPSMLIGTAENWTLMKTISVTEYLNYEAGKFSKSKGVGVFGNDAKDTGIPVEVWRYYLLTNRPEVSDTLFTWTDLQAKLNSELLSNLGNFINRVLSFIAKDPGSGYGSIIPDAQGAESHSLTKVLGEKVGSYVEQYIEAMEKVKLKQGLKIAMSISGEGNAYLQESQFWKLYKEDLPSCSVVMKTSVGLVYLLACLLEPFMPSFSLEVLKQLDLPPETQISLSDEKGDIERAKKPWEIIPAGHKIGTPAPLFRVLEDKEVEFFREKFAGSQADRIVKAEAEAKKLTEKLKGTKVSDGNTSKKDRPKKSAEAKPNVSASVEAEISISRLDIRVGLITKAQKHPDADSLYVEEIDVGEAQPRTVVSGLVEYIPLEEMQNRKVCVLCNLKPAAMRGIKSQAMVLAASNSDYTKVELVEPPQDAIVGERVTFPGFEGTPDEVLNPKKKVWETLQVDLHSDKKMVGCYKDMPFTTSAGVCKVSSIREGSIR
ncbi:probable methionine--tRNA ligase [Olea europaea var. sylvestris]|uniref:probable methionine--tRNA ligase n=1 Tax=Olea europaea var. sylvestris TaxID=158386 RepID=UPI000C1CDCB0|nr:probable methionine--tRNA ligase [Olea europaea var. sylvestris]